MITLFWVIAALVAPGRFIDRLVEIDLRLELAGNKELAASGEARIREFRRELQRGTQQRVSLLRRSLVRSFGIILSAAIIALLVARLPAFRHVVWQTFPRDMSVVSLGLFAWATLAKLGVLTWGQQTTVERADESMFRLLYWLGTFAGVLALSSF